MGHGEICLFWSLVDTFPFAGLQTEVLTDASFLLFSQAGRVSTHCILFSHKFCCMVSHNVLHFLDMVHTINCFDRLADIAVSWRAGASMLSQLMVTKKTFHTANVWRTSSRKSILTMLKHSLENILEDLALEGTGSEVSFPRMEETGSKVLFQRRLGVRTGSRVHIYFGVTIYLAHDLPNISVICHFGLSIQSRCL